MEQATLQHDAICYAGHRISPEVIGYAVWLYYCFPLSLRMLEELLAARGIELLCNSTCNVLAPM